MFVEFLELWKVEKSDIHINLEGFKIVGAKIFPYDLRLLPTCLVHAFVGLGVIEVTSASMQSAIQSYLEAA